MDADGGDGASELSKSKNFVICCCFFGWYPRLSLAYDVQDMRPGGGGSPLPPKKKTRFLKNRRWTEQTGLRSDSQT